MRLHPIRALGLISTFAVILTLLGACGHQLERSGPGRS